MKHRRCRSRTRKLSQHIGSVTSLFTGASACLRGLCGAPRGCESRAPQWRAVPRSAMARPTRCAPQARFEAHRGPLSPYAARAFDSEGVRGALVRVTAVGLDGRTGSGDASSDGPSSPARRNLMATADGFDGTQSLACFVRGQSGAAVPSEPRLRPRVGRATAGGGGDDVASLLSMGDACPSPRPVPPPQRGGTKAAEFERHVVGHRSEVRAARDAWTPARQGIFRGRELATSTSGVFV